MTSVKPDKTRNSDTDENLVNAHSRKPSYDLELRVGIFFILAVIVCLYGWSWLKSFSLLHPPQLITVQFHDIAGLANNAPVNINGVRVGTVEQIDLKGKGQVLVHLKIKTEEVKVPQGSHFTIQTLGLVGAKYIEISLPEEKPGEVTAPIIENDTVVIGHDPVRLELIANKIASNVNDMIARVSDDETQSSFASAMQNSGKTIENINEAASKLNKNMDKVIGAAQSISTTSAKFGEVADKAKSVTASADNFFKQGGGAFSNVKSATSKVNKMLDNPGTATDIKETARLIKETAASIKQAITELNTTLKDKPLRDDLISLLEKVNKSTEDIAKSMGLVEKISDDKGLREDIKGVVGDAKEAVFKVEKIIAEPTFKTDLKVTIHKFESAAENVDLAAKQLNNVLDKKAPLLHMMFGRPGAIKDARRDLQKEARKDSGKTTEEKATPKLQRIKVEEQ